MLTLLFNYTMHALYSYILVIPETGFSHAVGETSPDICLTMYDDVLCSVNII